MNEKEKNTNIIRWLSASFLGWKWMSIFVSFRFRPKMKNAFRSASSIHHKKVLVLGLVMQSLGLGLEHYYTRLGLGLGFKIKVLFLILVLKKSRLHHWILMLSGVIIRRAFISWKGGEIWRYILSCTKYRCMWASACVTTWLARLVAPAALQGGIYSHDLWSQNDLHYDSLCLWIEA